ncbi:MAG: double-strand break repair protein AddB, partial [Alphaproteobacteria bacterium]|nr:double-strand break repair protein AddB [Alphaproteobacteria bacterium]
RARMAESPPEAMAEVCIFVNTALMRQRITAALAAAGPGFLPRIRLVAEIGSDPLLTDLGPAASPLRRRLELARLIERLIERAPDLAPRAATLDLARALADLMDEMAGEGVAPEALSAIDVSGHAAHWARARAFLGIVAEVQRAGGAPEPGTRQRAAIAALIARWVARPPGAPVIVAGSTGSRGGTALLMAGVAQLDRGAVILPGFDFGMPPDAWAALNDRIGAEDHPQTRARRLLDRIGVAPADVARWSAAPPPDPARNRLISVALRPAPVTDRWLAEAPGLGDVGAATRRMTLIEAPSPRAEAGAIALVLREAVSRGLRAALVTPDRTLARQVTSALERWRIVPDDSAGEPLNQTAPGRLLRHAADWRCRRAGLIDLLVLMRHPLVHAGAGRGDHLARARALEARLRARGPVFPDAAAIGAAVGALVEAGEMGAQGAVEWAEWLGGILAAAGPEAADGPLPLAHHVAAHRALAETLAAGPGGTAAPLWEGPAGTAAEAVLGRLGAEADAAGAMTAEDHARLVSDILAGESVRETVAAHARVAIRGTREARVETSDLVVLGGLNDGVWPSLPPPDPWLNRPMRMAAGLLPPERRIGLAAHDFTLAAAAPEVVLTRAVRDAEAQTVPSRWLNRLTNLLGGMAAQGGEEALGAMRARGRGWLLLAATLVAPVAPVPRARRPSPCPPVAVRPRHLSVTEITTLIRDPYAIYARHVLRLRPLDPLRPEPDALRRGTVLHRILEGFLRARVAGESAEAAEARLIARAREVLAEEVPWPSARSLWLARIARAAPHVIAHDRALGGVPAIIETRGTLAVGETGVMLTGRPDRIDIVPGRGAIVTDYKSGG